MISHWNYRVLRRTYEDEAYYAVHEVYYQEDGTVDSWTETPVPVVGEDGESLTWALKFMRRALRKPILMEIDGKLMEAARDGNWVQPVHRREHGSRLHYLRELGEFLARWRARPR